MILASEGGSKFNETLEKLKNSAGSTDKAFETMSNTTEYKFRKAMNQAKNAIMQFGITAMPAITKVIEKVSSMLETFGNLSPATQEWIIQAALMAAAIGPLSSGIGGLIKGITGLGKGISKVGAFFGIFGKGAAAATAATSGLGTAAATAGGVGGIGALITGIGGAVVAASPFILAGGAIAGACVLMKKSFDEAAESAKAEIVPSFAQAVDSMEGLSDATKEVVKDVNQQISTIEGKIIKFQADGSIVREEIDELTTDVTTLIDKTIEHINKKFEKTGEGVAGFLQTLNEEQKKTYNQGVEEAEKSKKEEVKILEEKKELIKKIKETARKEDRELTQAEMAQITLIIAEAEEAQLKARIESSEEYMTYKSNMYNLEQSATKDNATKALESAAEVRDKKKEIIEQEHENTVEHIKNNLKLNANQQKDLLDKAELYKNDRLKGVDAEYNGILGIIKNKFPEISDYIDEKTGKILSDQEAAAKKHERLEREKWQNVKVSAKEAYDTLQNMGKFNAGQEEAHLLKCVNSWKKYSNDVDDQIASVRRAFEQGAIDKETYQREIDRLTANKKFAQEQITALEDLIKEFLETGMSAETLKRKIAELQSKTIKITTEYVTTGTPPSTGGMHGSMSAKNQGTFSLPTSNTGDMARVIAHDSKSGNYGEVMDLPGGTRIYPNDISMRMARETAKGIVEEFTKDLKNDTGFSGEIIVPVILDGKEIARVTAPYLDRENGRKINLTGRMRGNV